MLIDNVAVNPLELDGVVLRRFLWWTWYTITTCVQGHVIVYRTRARVRPDHPVDLPLSASSVVLDDQCVGVGGDGGDAEYA